MAPILTYLLNNAPWFAVILIAIFVTWKISKYHLKLEDTKNKVDELPCESHRDMLREFSEKYDRLYDTVESTNGMVVEVNKWIMRFDNDMIDKLARKASPLKMTPLGNALFNASNAKETIDNNKDFLIKEMEKDNPVTAYDVEECALNALFRNIGHEMFNDIKHFIYYSPEKMELCDPETGKCEEVKVSIQSLVRLMSIYLRDLYLQKHKEVV